MNKATANKNRLHQKIAMLEKQSNHVKAELEDELIITREKVTNIGKIALGIGGGLFFSALVLGRLNARKGKKGLVQNGGTRKRVYQRFLDQLIAELSANASDFIIGIAKDRLKANWDKKEKTEDDDSEFTGRKKI